MLLERVSVVDFPDTLSVPVAISVLGGTTGRGYLHGLKEGICHNLLWSIGHMGFFQALQTRRCAAQEACKLTSRWESEQVFEWSA